MNELQVIALSYRERGWSVIPIRARDKKPSLKSWKEFQSRLATLDEIDDWFSKGDCNIGILTGKISNLTVVDCDSEEAVALCGHLGIKPGPRVSTAHGQHFYCEYEEGSRNFAKRGDLPGIDLRSEGGYVVAPPSVHPSGAVYAWIDPQLPLPKLPRWILKPVRQQSATEGSRNVSLASLAGSLARAGFPIEHAHDYFLSTWNKKNETPLEESEVRQTVDSIYRTHLSKNAPLVFRSAGEIPVEETKFLWRPYLPAGELCMLAGHPGVGKSYLSLAIAADLTRGLLPDGNAVEPQHVVLFNAEDSLSKTVIPRLRKLKADLSRVSINGEHFTFHEAVFAQMRKHIEERKAGFVIIDPLTSFFPSKVNMNVANEVREQTKALISIAHDLNCVILVVHHYGKNLQVDNAVHRILGSQDLAAAPRSAMSIQVDDTKKTLVHIKHNLSAAGKSLVYEIKEEGLFWLGESDLKASELIENKDRATKQDKIEEWLGSVLGVQGREMEAGDVYNLAKMEGYSESTVLRAAKSLKITRRMQNVKEGRISYWSWPSEF
jgi:archaellum biogenesis ATPase FlaH